MNFYHEYEQNGYLSNFYPSLITLDNKQYPTNEHYFQSKKHEENDPIYAEIIRNAETPLLCK